MRRTGVLRIVMAPRVSSPGDCDAASRRSAPTSLEFLAEPAWFPALLRRPRKSGRSSREYAERDRDCGRQSAANPLRVHAGTPSAPAAMTDVMPGYGIRPLSLILLEN